MEFHAAVRTVLRRYNDFSGRSGRSEYWYFVLFNAAVAVVTSGIDNVILGQVGGINVVQTIAMLVLFVPGLSVAVRRMHDIGKSGWILLVVLIPILGLIYFIFLATQPSKDEGNAYVAA
jgi:uncharacterized membrane protein YhaH (DUF805 family)